MGDATGRGGAARAGQKREGGEGALGSRRGAEGPSGGVRRENG